MFNIECVALKKSKPLCFAIKEKLLKSDGVKVMTKTWWKNNDWIPFPHRSENEGVCYLGDSLNKNILSEK